MRKVLSLVVTFAMLFSIVAPAALAETTVTVGKCGPMAAIKAAGYDPRLVYTMKDSSGDTIEGKNERKMKPGDYTFDETATFDPAAYAAFLKDANDNNPALTQEQLDAAKDCLKKKAATTQETTKLADLEEKVTALETRLNKTITALNNGTEAREQLSKEVTALTAGMNELQKNQKQQDSFPVNHPYWMTLLLLLLCGGIMFWVLWMLMKRNKENMQQISDDHTTLLNDSRREIADVVDQHKDSTVLRKETAIPAPFDPSAIVKKAVKGQNS